MWIFWYFRNANSYRTKFAKVNIAHRAAEGVRCWNVNLSSPNVNDLRSGASTLALNTCASKTAACVSSHLTCTKSRFGDVCVACWYG